MIEEGCLDGVDEVYGLHNHPGYKEGQIAIKEGTMMSAISGVKIIIKGKGGHGSMPHIANDVITAGATILTNIHTIKTRSVPLSESMIVSITQFKAGDCNNVFPEEALIDGTIRAFSN